MCSLQIANPKLFLVFQSANRKFTKFSPQDREDETPSFKVWLLVGHFKAKPPEIRPQICSAECFYLDSFELEHFKLMVQRKIMHSLICGSFKPTKELGPQIAHSQIAKKEWVSANLPHQRKVRNSNKICKSANCGFVVHGTCLRTAHLCVYPRFTIHEVAHFHSFGFWLENTFRGILMSILYHIEITSRFVHLVNQILHETSLCAKPCIFYTRTKTIISGLLHLMEGWTEDASPHNVLFNFFM